MKILAILMVLWLPFSIGCLAAILASLVAVVVEENAYGKNLLRAMDKVLAAVMGRSGFYTLSAECGVIDAFPFTQIRTLLDLIQPGHCEGAAIHEGLLKGQDDG